MGQGSAGILRIFSAYPHIVPGFRAFRAPPREKGRNIKAFSGPSPPQGDSVNKAELTAALAMRTKMSKADATRTIDALFDDKGIIAGELKKGAKVRSEEHTSELQSQSNLVCRLL